MSIMRSIALCIAALVTLPAAAADYPTRPITMVVPFPPGASTDFVARVLNDPMAQILGQPIIVENRPGAAGTTGTYAVATAPPDGYTILLTVNAPVTMNKYLQKNFPFDPRTALAPVTNAAKTSLFLAVNKALPVKTVSDLVDYTRKNPGKVSFGSAGIGSAHQIAGELLNQKTGIHMEHIPYRGGGPAIQDLVAGQIPVSFGTGPAVISQAEAGTIRIIAAAEAERDPLLPDVPTIDETVPGIVTWNWIGIFAPAGTPRPIIDKLNKAAVAVLKRPEIVEKLALQDARPIASTPDELSQVVTTESDRWGTIIPSLGIQPQ